MLGARIIIPKTILKNRNFHVSKNLSRKFSDPPPPRARSENPIVFHAEMCFDGWVSVARRGFFSQGLFFGPMSSLPVIYSNRFGVNALHPTRYRPPANVTGHPQKRTTMVGGPLGKATYGRENFFAVRMRVLRRSRK